VRILVTGGAGFTGSHYARTLLSGGYPGYSDAAITVLDSLTYAGNPANLDPVAGRSRLQFARGDIAGPELVRSLVPGHDAVISFAAATHVDRSISGAARLPATNVAGVQVLLQACLDAGVGTVVQVSADEVHGSVEPGAGWDMVTRVPDRKGHDWRYSLDDSAPRKMGYAPRIPFRQGLEETVRWYADHRSWWEPLKPPAAAADPAGPTPAVTGNTR
jgi:dTDP-D-glucose 4,6-dehydratase